MAARWWCRLWDRLLHAPQRARPMGLVAVQMSINPFELFMLLAACVTGVLYLVGLPAPGSVAALLPPLAVKLWAANLGLGGVCAMTGGLMRRHLERGLAAYQFGWGLVGVGTLVYGLALMLLFPVAGFNAGLSNLMFAVAAFTRVFQVQRFFRLSEQVMAGDRECPPVPAIPGRGDG